jgi:hypothetical protein
MNLGCQLQLSGPTSTLKLKRSIPLIHIVLRDCSSVHHVTYLSSPFVPLSHHSLLVDYCEVHDGSCVFIISHPFCVCCFNSCGPSKPCPQTSKGRHWGNLYILFCFNIIQYLCSFTHAHIYIYIWYIYKIYIYIRYIYIRYIYKIYIYSLFSYHISFTYFAHSVSICFPTSMFPTRLSIRSLRRTSERRWWDGMFHRFSGVLRHVESIIVVRYIYNMYIYIYMIVITIYDGDDDPKITKYHIWWLSYL